jgi:single-strand DNA-binding protein
MSINITVLTGRLTTDPELKKTQNNTSVTSFCIAVDRKYQPQGEEKKTDFIDCVAWRNTAEFITKYFSKGSMIGIEGEIQTRTYTDKEGKNRKATEIVINNASFCGSKADNTNPAENTNTPQNANFATFSDNNNGFTQVDMNDGDLPF